MIGGEPEITRLALGDPAALDALVGGRRGTWTTSGRGALWLALRGLRERGVRHVHLPAYVCESVVLPVRALGMEHSFYPVDAGMRALPDPPQGAAVVLVHYFGWPNPATAELRTEAEAGRCFLVEDATHALLSDRGTPLPAPHAEIFSLRKLAPLPLGGWCSGEGDAGPASPATEALVWRSLAGRLLRAQYLAATGAAPDPAVEETYLATFAAVEEHLDREPGAEALPLLVRRLAAGTDWEETARRRRANWLHLRELLGGVAEPATPALEDGVVPLGFVVRLRERDRVRAEMARRRIFCPVHWPLPAAVDRARFPGAAALAETVLTLPLDARYGEEEMETAAAALREVLGR